MSPTPEPARRESHRLSAYCGRLCCAAAIAFGLIGTAEAQEERPAAAVLLDRLCANRLLPNEEDRLFGLISITVRATIKYEGGEFSPDLIDDAVQDALGALIEACPQLATTDDAHRLGRAVELVRDATAGRLRAAKPGRGRTQIEHATAADLSEELSVQEIDAWLDALPARRRALALMLYATDLVPQEMADAVGLSPATLPAAFRGVKADLLKFLRAESDSAPSPPPARPALEYREAGQPLAGLLQPAAALPATARITGISSDIYAGWSLLATVRGLAAERSLDLDEPILLEPDRPGRKRMIVVGLDEMSDPHDAPRHFLLKAFAIDADKEGSGMHDGFHLAAAALDNPEARRTLDNPNLAAIEIARCLGHDYGTAGDPGLCR